MEEQLEVKARMENEIIKTIKRMMMTKKLNFLVGSGTSSDSIGLMKDFSVDGKFSKELLLNKVSEVSKILLDKNICDYPEIENNLKDYSEFIISVVQILNLSNSRQNPKSANIFTTNYDLFIEKSLDYIPKSLRYIFNDGARGYITRKLDSSNYNQVVSYKGLNDNYLSEIPSITLIKPHGSVNWFQDKEDINIRTSVSCNPVVVHPDGLENQNTFLNNHFHEMLRVFQLELDKPQSVLFVIGFSFQDKHIAKMITRALQNPELLIYVFAYSDSNKQTFLKNLNMEVVHNNFKILTPSFFTEDNLTSNVGENGEIWYNFTLSNLTNIISNNIESEKKHE